jgi:hypothetical protein
VEPEQKPAKPRALKIAIAAAAVLAVGLAGALWWKSHRGAAAVPTEAVSTAPASETPAPTPAAVQPPPGTVLTNEAIIQMWKAKVPPSLIVSQMKAAKTQFDLSTNGVILLSQAGLPEYLVEAMRDPSRARIPAAVPGIATVPPAAPGAAPSIPVPTPPKPAEAPALPAAKTLTLADGTPVNIILMEDVPLTVETDAAIRFQTAEAVQVDQKIVIPKAATVKGTIVDATKKRLLRDSKVTFRLEYVEAADGTKISLRTSAKAGAAAARLEHPHYSAPKGMVAAAGTPYSVYVDGEQKVAVR